MTTVRKSYPITDFKALAGEPGRFEALVAVFGNVDLQGDRVMPGAFTKSLQRKRAEGDPIPVIWSHDWADPFAHIGAASPVDVKQTSKGLRVVGQLDVEKPFAAQVYDLLKNRRVKEFSFSYDVIRERIADDGANELIDLELIEVGPTLKGANPETELVGVKAALEAALEEEKSEEPDGEKAGRTISKTNENKIRTAISTLEEVLESTSADDVEDAKAIDNTPPEEPQEEPVVETVDEILRIRAQAESIRNGGKR